MLAEHGSADAAIEAFYRQREEQESLIEARRVAQSEGSSAQIESANDQAVAALLQRELDDDAAERGRIERMDAERMELERSNEHLRAQERARLQNDNLWRDRVLEFYESSTRDQWHLNNFTDEEEGVIKEYAAELSAAASREYVLTVKKQGKREGEYRLFLKKTRKQQPQPQQQQQQSPASAPAPPRPRSPIPVQVDYNNHTKNLMVAAAEPASNGQPRQPRPRRAPGTPSREAAAAGRPPPYQGVSARMWLFMFELPFRVKYEVEVMSNYRNLHRCWEFMPENFVIRLLECVHEHGEAACIATIRAMMVEGVVAPLLVQFDDLFRRRPWLRLSSWAARDRGAPPRPVSERSSVEVLSAQHCCPSGRTVVRQAEWQSSNRVLRLIGDLYGTDHLLRVSFVNDGTYAPIAYRGPPQPGFANTQEALSVIARYWRERRARTTSEALGAPLPSKWDAVTAALRHGIYVGGEHFRWLAPSSSQMKSTGMWFVRESSELNASLLRRCLGDFTALATPALYLSRMGQCLSTTTVSTILQPEGAWDETEVDEVVSESGELVFSDGCGYASYKLFQLLVVSLRLQELSLPHGARWSLADLAERGGAHMPYSAVQVRVGGKKGVLSLRMGIEGLCAFTRGSMRKFDADIRDLEVCEFATWHAGYLNRYVITLLEHLGVPCEAFEALQEQYLHDVNASLANKIVARRVLKSCCMAWQQGDADAADGGGGGGGGRGRGGALAEGGPLHAAIGMVEGDIPLDEPFVHGILEQIRNALVRDVVERARIVIPQAATLMGVMDEEGVLDYGEVFVQTRPPDAPDEVAGGQVVEGKIVVYRSPGMHPADVRVLTAVARPELMHLVNVVVFPQRGVRPHPIELSRGDLDGDKYLLIWDPSIVHAVKPVDVECSQQPPVALHKQQRQQQRQPPPRQAVRPFGMPPKPSPPPTEQQILVQLTQEEERRRNELPHDRTLADFVGHGSGARRRGMSEGDVAAEGEILEVVRRGQVEEAAARIERELLRRLGSAHVAADEARERHERLQEKLAIRWFVFFGRRQNLGRISNLWLAHADRHGASHPDTLELCAMAERAVQFVKTGVPVHLDEKRFHLKRRPDFMAAARRHGGGATTTSSTASSTSSTTYTSTRALGKLYRAAVATPLATTRAPREALASSLEVRGYEPHLAKARAARDAYYSEVEWFLKNYGIEAEASLLSGRVACFSTESMAHTNLRDAEETLRRSFQQTWSRGRRAFDEAVAEAAEADPASDRALTAQRVAYAWYYAGCEDRLTSAAAALPRGDEQSAVAAGPPREKLCSFPWVAWPELVTLLRRGGGAGEAVAVADFQSLPEVT